MKVNIGKNTLGGGKKMVTSLNNYRRSTHDLSFICRTTMAPGVLVPTMKLLMEPGDTFEIETRCHTLTHPTVGPLFGSFKQQNDFFFCPIRLYNAMLHNNTLNIGLNMAQVKLPVMKWDGSNWKQNQNGYIAGSNNTLYKMVHPSSLLAYLGLRSLAPDNALTNNITWQCVPVLAYYDIFKNYYANKQEENFYVVDGSAYLKYISGTTTTTGWQLAIIEQSNLEGIGTIISGPGQDVSIQTDSQNKYAALYVDAIEGTLENITVVIQYECATGTYILDGTIAELTKRKPSEGAYLTEVEAPDGAITGGKWYIIRPNAGQGLLRAVMYWAVAEGANYKAYPLTAIDETREAILASGRNQFIITSSNAPYIADLLVNDSENNPATANPMQGLCLKTYQSDINTNWINTEWLEGDNGINEITAIDTSSGSFTIDQLNLASKVYKMLNRIAVSDGSYNAWIQTVFTAGGLNHIETPLYLGGSSLEIEFQEVISNSATADEPLGSYAGRGVATNKKGGHIRFKADEPGYIMCITSITPRVDYFQGNEWDMYLETLDDLHKPQLDAIGFQDRLYSRLNASVPREDRVKSIGKQPSWIEYMTNVNKTYGNFALAQNEGWMCLNRVFGGVNTYTTYVQPHLYNNIFAETEITAQNFWVQIGFDIKARRVMSAKQIPNL